MSAAVIPFEPRKAPRPQQDEGLDMAEQAIVARNVARMMAEIEAYRRRRDQRV